MIEFLKQNLTFVGLSIEFIAALTGLIYLKKYKSTAAIFFIYYLVYTFVCDLLGSYTYFIKDEGIFSFLENTVLEKNYWFGTLYWSVGAILFFGFYYFRVLKNKKNKSIIKFSNYVFFIFSILYISLNFNDFFLKFFPVISIAGAVIILMCSSLFFIEILKSEEILNFYSSINFYISLAIFFWWLIITPIVFYNIYNSKADWDFVILKWQIYLFANIFMYTTFTIGLIVSKPEKE